MKQKTIELVKFLHNLYIKKKVLKSNQSMILAISGGQDSISLLFIFLQLKDQWNWKLKIIYCNHLWQKDSFYSFLHLFKLAYLLNIDIYLAVTLQQVLTEQKARDWRSLTFQRITGFYLFTVVLTGHSKSDRIETGFFNLFRGSGTQGIGSLNWKRVILKDNFFKCNRNHLFQSSILFEKRIKFLVMGLTFFLSFNGPSSFFLIVAWNKRGDLKKCTADTVPYSVLFLLFLLFLLFYEKKAKSGLIQIIERITKSNSGPCSLLLIPPFLYLNKIGSLGNSSKDREVKKYGIANIIKKFYKNRVLVHFSSKCTLKNKQNKTVFTLKKKQKQGIQGIQGIKGIQGKQGIKGIRGKRKKEDIDDCSSPLLTPLLLCIKKTRKRLKADEAG